MSVEKQCLVCHKRFKVSQGRSETAKFCCRACADEGQKTQERRDILCENCGASFSARKDHGAWPRFCGRACFLNACVQPIEKQCEQCGVSFKAARSGTAKSEDGRRRFCSDECRQNALFKQENRTCLNCSEMFSRPPSSDHRCCSTKCRNEHFSGENSHKWKGGQYLVTASGDKMVKYIRQGYTGPYIGEHRLVASRAIGRDLFSFEIVIRVSGERDDISADNLFICSSISEYCKRREGSLPWPTASNLSTYRDTGAAA